MKTILIGGGTGLVGSHIIDRYKGQYKFHVLSRSKRQDEEHVKYFTWDTRKMTMDKDALGCDYLINLAGAGIADKRWSTTRKRILIESRVKTNELLHQSLSNEGIELEAIANASAIGYYGDRGAEVLTEESSLGNGFLAECCDLWEKSSDLLLSQTRRLSKVRIGVVLSSKGGALPKIIMTKGVGVLSYFGAGEMYYSWIHIDDVADLFIHMLEADSEGIVNAVSPQSMTNKAFTKGVKQGLASNALVLPAPTFGVRLALGEMADVVLNSTRVESRMSSLGYDCKFTTIEEAVADVIKYNK